jgi:hypothetical protein
VAVLVGVADAVGFSTDWLGFGAVVVAFAVVVAGLGVVVVALGCVDVAAAVVTTDFALTTGAFVVAAAVVAAVTCTLGFVVCAAGARVVCATGALVVATTDFCATDLVRTAVDCESVADGCHAGSSVASTDRSGSAMEGAAVPPATVTAPTDFGPSNSWNTPMMPVRMNIVMSHSCQRFALTPTAKPPAQIPKRYPP